ncbi:MAG: hypothetical protein H7X76_01960 [Prolixibacteraceae bacterium]|nr:hypothetical protein [Burkholderiales bacterium]
MSHNTTQTPAKRLSLVEPRSRRDSLREVSLRDVSDPISSASLHDIYGGSLEGHLAFLKRLTRSGGINNKSLTSLTVFHLVEMELLARDERGEMCVTPLGALVLEDYERGIRRGARPGDQAQVPPALVTVR